MRSDLVFGNEYKKWLAELKQKVRSAQLKAAVRVNSEMLLFYWGLGADIVAKQAHAKWGEGFLTQLSKDLMSEFPNMKGFSKRNLELIRQWYLFYDKDKATGQQHVALIAKQAVSQLTEDSMGQHLIDQITQIPWGHNIAIVSKCRNIKEALFYVRNTITHNWSRDVLVHQIESGLYKREGKSLTNFALTLPKPQSDLAQQTLKNPYIFDFLAMRKDYDERDLETALISHVTHFLLEMGAGFSFIGRQVPIRVGTKEFFIDLLFYHARLHCYVVVELLCGAPHKSFSVALPVMWRNSPLALFTGTPLNSAPHNFIPFVSLLYSRAKNLKGGLYHVRSTVSETSSRKTSFQRTAFRNPLKLSHLSHYAKDVTVHASYNSRLSTGCDEVSSPQRRQTGLYSPRGWKSCQPLGPSRN
jgi:predicted nuclease of restriction endonuclease-like (RecB) superfamily